MVNTPSNMKNKTKVGYYFECPECHKVYVKTITLKEVKGCEIHNLNEYRPRGGAHVY